MRVYKYILLLSIFFLSHFLFAENNCSTNEEGKKICYEKHCFLDTNGKKECIDIPDVVPEQTGGGGCGTNSDCGGNNKEIEKLIRQREHLESLLIERKELIIEIDKIDLELLKEELKFSQEQIKK